MTENEMVRDFNLKFGLPAGDVDILDSARVFAYRFNFLNEELDEFRLAWTAADRVKMFDALIDLVYVAHGTALMMGIKPDQWTRGFIAVHKANMAKVRAASLDDSKRKSLLDVIKPEGWVPPEEMLREILKA